MMEERVGRFSLWKAKATQKLIDIARKYENNEKFVEQITALITRMRYAKRRDLSIILNDIWHMYRYWKVKELLDIIPSEEELYNMLIEKEGGQE